MINAADLGHHVPGQTPAGVLSLVTLWFAMMCAMMAPAAWPWVTAFRRLAPGTDTSCQRDLTTALFIAGYALAWLLYSLAAALAQVAIAAWSAGASAPPTLAASVLIGAGVVQFTPLKRACLRHCRHPLTYLMTRWNDAPRPAWRIGFGHGLFCVGCCWALMATMLTVGMTNLWWMVALSAATLLEQVIRRGNLVRIGIGIALVAAGCVLLTAHVIA